MLQYCECCTSGLDCSINSSYYSDCNPVTSNTNLALGRLLLLWQRRANQQGVLLQTRHVTRCFFFCFTGFSVFAKTLPALLAFRFSEAIMDLS